MSHTLTSKIESNAHSRTKTAQIVCATPQTLVEIGGAGEQYLVSLGGWMDEKAGERERERLGTGNLKKCMADARLLSLQTAASKLVSRQAGRQSGNNNNNNRGSIQYQ